MGKYKPFFAIAVGILSAVFAFQWYQTYNTSTFYFPATINSEKALPVVFVFPAMGGDAATITQEIVGQDAIIVRFHEPNNTFPTFSTTLLRAERQIKRELATIHQKYRIDSTKIVCCGFSLGGDVAYALALRHNIPITHALIMGSRCTYRLQALSPSAATTRYSFIVGDIDERITQHTQAADYLTNHHCKVYRKVITGLSHSVPNTTEISSAFTELLK